MNKIGKIFLQNLIKIFLENSGVQRCVSKKMKLMEHLIQTEGIGMDQEWSRLMTRRILQ